MKANLFAIPKGQWSCLFQNPKMMEDLFTYIPYGVSYLFIMLLRLAPIVFQSLVGPHEPDAEIRLRLESCCLYTNSVTGLITVAVTSWIAALAKAGEALVRTKTGVAVTIFILSFITFLILSFYIVKYVRTVAPDNYHTACGGLVGMSVATTLRLLQVSCVTLGLLVSIVVRVVRISTVARLVESS